MFFFLSFFFSRDNSWSKFSEKSKFKRIGAFLSTQLFHFAKKKFSHFCFLVCEMLLPLTKYYALYFVYLFSITLPSSKEDLRQLTKNTYIYIILYQKSKENRAGGGSDKIVKLTQRCYCTKMYQSTSFPNIPPAL